MSRFNVTRTNIAMPADMEGARQLLFKCLDGFGEEDRKAWRKLWKKLINLAPGEIFEVHTIFSRSGPFHRRHMALEQKVFDSQEQFDDFEAFRNWLKLGSGWVIWAPGEDGTLTPVPKSTSYAAAEQGEFEKFHAGVLRFLRSPHAGPFLWPHLEQKAIDQIEYILRGFGE